MRTSSQLILSVDFNGNVKAPLWTMVFFKTHDPVRAQVCDVIRIQVENQHWETVYEK
jgi:hypothetical protein